MPPVKPLDAALIEGFQRHYLHSRFDDASGTADFHRVMWEEACDPDKKRCAWAAPRGHAKSTAVTLTFALAAAVFRFRDHILIVSDSEGQAVHQLKELRNELTENEELIKDFNIKGLLKDAETELIVVFSDGYQLRMLAKGSEQRLRGLKWRGKRPNLVLGDDMEFDEIVTNAERLRKFKDWFFKQLMPAGSKDCLFRIVGTILSFNSLLMDLMAGKHWTTHLWRAHADFDDFSDILWPSRWPEEDLREIRSVFMEQGKADGYSQEYLNQPIADGESFFDKDDLIEIPRALHRDWELFPGRRMVNFYASVDLAVSTAQRADRSAITVASLDADNYLDIVEVVKGRFDPKTLFEHLFRVQEEYEPMLWLIEAGAIQKSLGPFLNEEMARRNVFLDLHLMTPSRDKKTRARSIQARMKAGRVRFDKSAGWYQDVEQELLQFDRGAHDDVVDTMSQLGMALDKIIAPPSEDDVAAEDYRRESEEASHGRNKITGY